MSDSNDSTSSSFFSDDEDAYRRDYQLEREHKLDDLAQGGLKPDSTGVEKKTDSGEKQPEVIRQTTRAFLQSSKFVGFGGAINDSVVQSLDESLKHILEQVDAGHHKPTSGSRFNRLNRRLVSATEPSRESDNILKSVRQTSAYTAAQLKPVILPTTEPLTNKLSPPNVQSSLTSNSHTDENAASQPFLKKTNNFPGVEKQDSVSEEIDHNITVRDARYDLNTLSQHEFEFELEHDVTPSQPCQLNETQFTTFTDSNSYSLSLEDIPYPLSKKVMLNNKLAIFCYNIESMPNAEDVALLWCKVLTSQEDGRKFNTKNPYTNRVQSACVIVQGLQRIFYVLPNEPIELIDTELMSSDEINELLDRAFTVIQDSAYEQDDYVCIDNDVLPSGNERNQADIINISVFEHLKTSILSVLQTKYNIIAKTVSIRPVWRRYVFNEQSLPRNPRIWIEVMYPANKPMINIKHFGDNVIGVCRDAGTSSELDTLAPDIGIRAIVGHTITPLEIWLAKMRISGPMWLTVSGIDWDLYASRTTKISELIKKYPQFPLSHVISLYNDKQSCTLLYHEFHVRLSHNVNNPTIEPLYKILNKKDSTQIPLPLLSVCTVHIRYTPEIDRIQLSKENKEMSPTVKNIATTAVINYHPGYSIEGSSFQTELLTQTHILVRKLSHINILSDSTYIIPLSNLSYNTLDNDTIQDSTTICIRIKLVDKELQLFENLSKVLMHFNPDIIVGHNIYFHLYNALWSSRSCLSMDSFRNTILVGMSRLNPRILHIDGFFKTFQPTRSSWYVLSILHGRLLVDLEKGINEFALDTKLTTIEYATSSLLKKDLYITPPSHFADKFKSGVSFKTQLIPELVSEILALIGISNALNYLPLTCRISQLTALPWQLVCSVGRARRAESLILHNFAVMPYILPDLESKQTKVQVKAGAPGAEEDNHLEVGYEGGYVMDPVVGLHDTIVMVLDFNSLYPSIIREYDICFTTLDPRNYTPAVASKDSGDSLDQRELQEYNNKLIEEEVSAAKKVKHTVILPRIIARLITQRLIIKGKIKDIEAIQATDPITTAQRLKILDISQLAIKLCANSMYGSLGYQHGRFYCPHVAARIPAKGRMELTRASNIAHQLGYKIIYGDTDSIMVKTTLKYNKDEAKRLVGQIRNMANSISDKVGENRKYLKLSLDYIFIKYLLFQKKKYAALRIFSDLSVSLEYKGLDLVRRDWCPIAQTISKKALNIIMFESQDRIISSLISMLTMCYKSIMANRTPAQELKHINQFKMTKSLTKHLKQYSASAITQLPHVNVANEIQRTGKAVRMGDIIEYLILSNVGLDILRAIMASRGRKDTTAEPHEKKHNESSTVGISDITRRAIPFDYYISYLSTYPSVKVLDMNWYIRNQILPPLQRVCTHLADLSVGQLAECFGIDSREYVTDTIPGDCDETFNRQDYSIDIRHRFNSCCCFIYHCTCGSPKSVTAWPPPLKEYQSSEDAIITPYPNLDTPSNAYRKNKALENGEPLLSPLDFDTLRCGCNLKLGTFMLSLNKQLNQLCRLYEEQLSYCVYQTCPLYMQEDVRKKIYPGCYTNQLNAYNISYKKYAIASLYGKNCKVPGCGGSIVPVFTASMLSNQLLFFSLIFDLTSPLYTVPEKHVTPYLTPGDRLWTIFNEGKKLVNTYISRNSYMWIDLTEKIETLFIDLATNS